LSGISLRYGDNIPILKNASLFIRKGEKIILSGKSGTGKTTLLYLLLRFIKEQEGTISVDGVTLTDQNALAWRRNIGYVPQNPYILDASVKENIAFGVPDEQIDLNKIGEVIGMMDLGAWVDALPEKIDTVIGERGARISGGQRQRLAIARALYHDAEILLLDEVTNQLDAQTETEVMKAIDHLMSQKKTIILITHHPDLWTSFDAVYELKDGHFEKAPVKTMQTASGYAG
jgi:ABC-type bacteriocin/lantibiotic exporter with double-glycine peptidase domain